MLELGRKQVLTVIKSVDFGVYLAESADADRKDQVLLPAKQVPAGAQAGDRVEVFIYKDSQDRLIATVHEPLCEVGGIALLKVKQVTKIGAFLDWGLEKDLLLPYHEQTRKVKAGEEVLVVKSNEIAIPVVGCEGNEDFIVINFKVPTGANKGTEPYDGYALAEDYVHNLAEKERKAEERKAEKARKIERDKEIRRKRAEIAEKGGK